MEAPGETWMAVEMALSKGRRGLPGGSSLALQLAQKRGARNTHRLPDLGIEQILQWVDAFQERTGKWPLRNSGPIAEAPGETWGSVDEALRRGRRGLLGRRSLAELLGMERGARSRPVIPRLSRRKILAWADAHHRRTGKWPTPRSGAIADAPDETWSAIETALERGNRGLRGGSSLARLLAENGRKRNTGNLPPLSHKKILAWADAHYERTGKWPGQTSGAVHEAPEERWDLIDNALNRGLRGLRGGSSVLQLLVRKRQVRDWLHPPALSEGKILEWAFHEFQCTGSWPKCKSRLILDVPGETWVAVDLSLRRGKRGLPGGSSLAKLLKRARQKNLAISSP